jgi:hypothetical protein
VKAAGIVVDGAISIVSGDGYQQRQAVEALAHVGVAGRQPHLHVTRKRDHQRLAFASAVTIASIVEASTGPVIRSRAPVANSTSIAVDGVAATSGTTATAENPGAARPRPHSSCRQRNNWLTRIQAARATSEATAPGSSAGATIRSFRER